MDRLACIQTFVRVAEAGTFAGVADATGITAAMVGRQVRWLEERLGAALIFRTTRRQSLTEAGRIFLEHAKAALAEIDAAEESVAQVKSTPRGRLRIDAPVTFGALQLAPLLPEFFARYPQIQVHLTLNNRLVDLVDEGYDAVVRSGDLPDSALIARALAPYRLLCCAAPAWIDQQGMPDTPQDLAQKPCLRFHPEASHEEWTFLDRAGSPVKVRISGPFASNSGRALLAAARGGAGAILQAEALLAEDIAAGRLVPILDSFLPRPLPMHVIYKGGGPMPLKLRAFLDFLTERLS